MSVELDPLLNRLAAFAPHFGRLQGDLEAMVSRGRTQDFKGVMQNARLVLEALLRSLVTEELKQTPGKAMLDELITKFRQQANAGVVPTNVLAHMGTVQAWGNLSSHDHAGSLHDAGVAVGQDEVVASLNSMLAVLAWYATKRGVVLDVSTKTPPVAATEPSAPPVHLTSTPAAPSPSASRGPLVFIVAGVALVGLLGAGYLAVRSSPGKDPGSNAPPDTTPPLQPFAALDALYASWKEPAAPPACRRVEDAARLAAIATDDTALALVDANPESSYLLARATFEKTRTRHDALKKALACPGFAAAENLEGRISLQEKRFDEARKHFLAAIAAAPGFVNARFNLALMFVQSGDLESARDRLDHLITENPSFGEAYFVRAAVLQAKGDHSAAATDACTASKLGVDKAKAECERLSPH
jgi:hypothetical protein